MPYGDRPRWLTAALVLWCVGLTTWVVCRVFGVSPPDIPGGTAAALSAVLGIPPAVFGLYQWARNRRENRP